MIDVDRLRRISEAATPGKRTAERLRDNNGTPYATLYETHIFVEPICGLWAPVGRKDREADAAHIAAFDRETCLELIDELTAARQRIAELEQALVKAAVPLECLFAVEMDSAWMSPTLKASVREAVETIRVALLAKGGKE